VVGRQAGAILHNLTKGETMKKLILLAITVLLIGCAHLGIANKETMMQRWRGQIADKGVTENTLWEINSYANWYAQGLKQYPVAIASEENLSGGFKPEKGKCQDQTELKLSILYDLGTAAKRGHCTIVRDPYRPVGHAFAIAQFKNKWILLDNGAVQGDIWEYESAKRSTYGARDWRVE
jgi:hypothetical protein